MDNVKIRITPEQEKMMNNVLEGDDDWDFFEKVVDTLVAENVDLSSAGESGLTPMEYIFDMYERHLLDSGQLFMRILNLVGRVADLNVNTYKAEDNLSDIERENIRSSLLHHILEVLKNLKVHNPMDLSRLNLILWMLIDRGARVWKPCYNPWDQKNEDGYVVEMWPVQTDATLFYDNMGCPTGDAHSITIEAEDGHTTKIDISGVEGLKAWHEEYKTNRENFAHDWQSWKKRGLSLAKTLAASFPTTISLFFPNFSEATLGHADPCYCALKKEHTTLCTSGKPIRIFP